MAEILALHLLAGDDVAVLGEPLARGLVSGGRHGADTCRVNPDVVVVEKRTHGQRVVDGFVRPSCCLDGIDVRLSCLRRIRIDLLDEGKKRLLRFRKRGCGRIAQDRIDQFTTSKQLRRDRGVGANSKRAVIALRGEGGNEFTLTGGQRRLAPHDFLRESG